MYYPLTVHPYLPSLIYRMDTTGHVWHQSPTLSNHTHSCCRARHDLRQTYAAHAVALHRSARRSIWRLPSTRYASPARLRPEWHADNAPKRLDMCLPPATMKVPLAGGKVCDASHVVSCCSPPTKYASSLHHHSPATGEATGAVPADMFHAESQRARVGRDRVGVL